MDSHDALRHSEIDPHYALKNSYVTFGPAIVPGQPSIGPDGIELVVHENPGTLAYTARGDTGGVEEHTLFVQILEATDEHLKWLKVLKTVPTGMHQYKDLQIQEKQLAHNMLRYRDTNKIAETQCAGIDVCLRMPMSNTTSDFSVILCMEDGDVFFELQPNMRESFNECKDHLLRVKKGWLLVLTGFDTNYYWKHSCNMKVAEFRYSVPE